MRKLLSVLLISAAGIGSAVADGWGTTQATNQNGIINTRHNLTQSFSGAAAAMNGYRNNYGEVCVYCHTPHGSNNLVAAPLWNRTRPNPMGGFALYNIPTTLGRPITQPGPNSLTCLSCHDGVTAVDSIMNMPGSGGYQESQRISVDQAFLDTWVSGGRGAGPAAGGSGHQSLQGCADVCHKVGVVSSAPFQAFVIGNDLRNDHPVGVQYPTSFGPGVDFSQPNGTIAGKMQFFDKNTNGRADVNEIRTYDSTSSLGGSDGYEVECGSCHDPHGVESAGDGSAFIPSFLRVSNAGSALCLTCHVK